MAATAAEVLELPELGTTSTPFELVASSPDREARAVVSAARAAIDAGVDPERIGLVVSDPALYRAALRRELDRRGVPASGSPAVGPTDPAGNRSRALLRAVESRETTPLDLGLDLAGPADLAERGAIRLALRALGCASLGDAAGLGRSVLERHRGDGVPLPVRSGRELADDGEAAADDASFHLARRRVAVEALERALDALRRLAGELASWPASATWAEHRRALARLVGALGPSADDGGRRLAVSAERLSSDLPNDEIFARREAIELLREVEAEAATSVVGAGGGIQLLTLVEARGRTFDRLFVLGLVRGVFPRPVTGEPVLPDPLRARLRDVLPDLPVKGERHDEERYLFAQLVGASGEVVLSRATHDEDGRQLAPSPLLEALRRDGRLTTWRGPDDPLVPFLDQSIAAGLSGDAAAHAAFLPLALEEGRQRCGAPGRATGAAGVARLNVLAEFETDPATAQGRERIRTLGPYFGLLGRAVPAVAPTATALEAIARCGWQAFLERGLRLEPLPDPIRELPGIESRWIGEVIHRVLQQLFDPAHAEGERTLEEALARTGVALHWPTAERVEELLRDASAAVLREAGLAGGGLEAALVSRARRRLEAARALDEDGAPALVLGCELDGALELADDRDRRERVRFRVDRATRETGLTVLADFKSGKPEPTLNVAKPTVRRARLLGAVRAGTRLQAALYAIASGDSPAEARYLFLAPDLDPDRRVLALDGGSDVRAALAEAAGTLLGARRSGLQPPRLLAPDAESEYAGCQRCAVSEACVRGDSGFRLRLARWDELQRGRTDTRTEDEERLWRLWRLPAESEEAGT